MNNKLLILFLLSLSLLLAACSAPPAQSAGETSEPDAPVQSDEPTAPEAGLPSAEHTTRAGLAAYLGLDLDAVTVVSVEETEFGNACLDAALSDEMCAEVITPGTRITLAAQGQQYLVHSNGAGTSLRLVSGHGADEPVILNTSAGVVDEVETPTMLWSVEGGIAGFCESIRVSGGSAEIASCDGSVSLASLTPAHAAQVDQWRQQFASFDYTDANEDAVADGMTVQIIFNGTGSAQPTEDDIAAMMDFLWGLLGSQ